VAEGCKVARVENYPIECPGNERSNFKCKNGRQKVHKTMARNDLIKKSAQSAGKKCQPTTEKGSHYASACVKSPLPTWQDVSCQ
jgi:hypothetical protein